MFELSAENISDYLLQRGSLDQGAVDSTLRVTRLEGGVSNITFAVDTGAGSVVVKQALDRLEVEGEWLADRARILREAAAIRAYAPALPPGTIPRLIFSDEDNFVIGIEKVEPPAVLWKDDILGGEVSDRHATVAGESLALMHAASPQPGDRALLSDLGHLEELRIHPYLTHTAQAHPDLAEYFSVATDCLLAGGSALVHGDFAPKNIFIRDREPFLTILDFEVAHVGNPALDLAFFLTHLVLKAIHLPDLSGHLYQSALSFWTGYRSTGEPGLPAGLENDASLLLPCLIAARVDGLSPVEYLAGSEAQLARDMARRLLELSATSVETSLVAAFDVDATRA
ncbi:MAG: phosphotransferase [Dehalococcoidia bacterium]